MTVLWLERIEGFARHQPGGADHQRRDVGRLGDLTPKNPSEERLEVRRLAFTSEDSGQDIALCARCACADDSFARRLSGVVEDNPIPVAFGCGRKEVASRLRVCRFLSS